MPSPTVHFLHGAITGAVLSFLTNGKFATIHTVIYAFNCFVGPDIGTGGEWLVQQLLGVVMPPAEESIVRRSIDYAADLVLMKMTHHPLFYVIIWAPLLGFVWHKMTTKFGWSPVEHEPTARGWTALKTEPDDDDDNINNGDNVDSGEEPVETQEKRKNRWNAEGVPFLSCFLLAAAGGLSHHFYDILFEDNGQEPFYRWILSTGWWPEDHDGVRASIDIWAVLVVALCVLGALVSVVWASRRSQSPSSRFARALTGISLVSLVYIVYNIFRIYILQPRTAAVGEEADLGVIVFMTVFNILPLFLCLVASDVIRVQPWMNVRRVLRPRLPL